MPNITDLRFLFLLLILSLVLTDKILSSLGPPGSSPTEKAVGRWRLVAEVDRRSNGDTRVGDLVRTWRRLVCYALAEVIVLDFRGTEVQRYGGERRHEGGL